MVVQAREPRRRDPASTRRAILDAARELMAERGPEAMTISEVAHRAGINRGTAYQHFRTRDELAAAVKLDFGRELTAMLVDDQPIGERIDRLLGFFLDHPELARLWIHDILSSRDGSPSESWNTFIATLEALTKSGGTRDGIDAEMLGRILLGAPLIWSLWASRKAEAEQERRRLVQRFGREIKRLLLFGVMKPEAWPAMVAELEAAASAGDERAT
ncbi:MAG: TetR/AcrR family transcriptional regulator [Deltaproteobacteria bacterium]|nr:TetR/AcrR family transcriptional regulator [Deltaproteobacteria bacterium]